MFNREDLHQGLVFSFPRAPKPGTLQWRRARGLMTISDLVADYKAMRRPRGAYLMPMPDDLIDTCEAPE